jgi:ferredoxin-NADP reductase
VRHADDVIYADELGEDAVLTFTREAPDGWTGHVGHVDPELVAQTAASLTPGTAFVCGSDGFVEAATQLLLATGFMEREIRTERFGATGQS